MPHSADGQHVGNADALRRLISRLDIHPGGDEVIELLNAIRPTTSIDELLKDHQAVQDDSGSITAGASTSVAIFTVPQGYQYTIYTFSIRRVSGDNTWRAPYWYDASEAVSVPIDFSAAGQTQLKYDITQPIVLDQYDQVYVQLDGAGAAATVIRMQAWLAAQKAYPYA